MRQVGLRIVVRYNVYLYTDTHSGTTNDFKLLSLQSITCKLTNVGGTVRLVNLLLEQNNVFNLTNVGGNVSVVNLL